MTNEDATPEPDETFPSRLESLTTFAFATRGQERGIEMKKTMLMALLIIITLLFSNKAFAQCTTIQKGLLYRSDGVLIETGFDEWGYNYQAHIFNGKYCDAYHDAAWCQPYKDNELEMKWNDAWLSNKDCNGDGLLDRPDDFGGTYIGSGAWLTNHQKGVYIDTKGKKQRWTYFVKIVAAPADAKKVGGVWYAADATEIGPDIWGAFAIIQEVYNDTGTGDHGVLYLSPYSAGFGRFSPKD